MKYMMLIYEPEGAYEGPDGEKAITEIVRRHMQLGES